MIRAGSAASLSALLNRLDPVLRETAHLGRFVDAINFIVIKLLTISMHQCV